MALFKVLNCFSVEEILSIQNSLGSKVFNDRWEGGKKKTKIDQELINIENINFYLLGGGRDYVFSLLELSLFIVIRQKKSEFKRENKNRPREISSKIRVPKLVKVVQVCPV